MKYFGNWESYEDFTKEFGSWGDAPVPPDGFPTDDQVLLASYDQEDYEGDCFVLYERDGKLYENNSSHCSCDGLEWEPEETTWDALALRPWDKVYGADLLARDLVKTLIAEHVK